MNGKILDELESAIQNVINKYCTDENRWPDFLCHDKMAEDMAKGAALVFDSCVRASQYTETEA